MYLIDQNFRPLSFCSSILCLLSLFILVVTIGTKATGSPLLISDPGGNNIDVNDSIIIDLSQQVCTGNFVEFDILMSSPDTVYALDLNVKLDLVNFAYNSVIAVEPYVIPSANLNAIDSTLRITAFGLQQFDDQTALIRVRLNNLGNAPINTTNISVVSSQLNGANCSFKILDYVSDTIFTVLGPNGSIDQPLTLPVGCNDSITYNFIPDSCYEVNDVVINGMSVGPVPTYTFTNISSDINLNVSFKSITPKIIAASGPNGCTVPTGSLSVVCGTDQLIEIKPDTCFIIDDVFVNGVSQGPISSFTFSNVQEPQVIFALFKEKISTITTVPDTGGAISPDTSITVTCHDTVQYSITPDSCYVLDDVLINGVSIGALTQVELSNVSENTTIEALFSPLGYVQGDGREDLNNDGIVDIADFLQFLAKFGQSCLCCPEDINLDGIVSNDDFLLLLAGYGLTF